MTLGELGFTGDEDFAVTVVFRPLLGLEFIDQVGVYVYQYEPTNLGHLLRRALPTTAENWVRTRFGDSLLSGPSAFSSHTVRRGDVPYVVDRLGRLSTVQTIRFPAGLLNEEDVGRLRKAMPKAEVEVDTRIGVAPRE